MDAALQEARRRNATDPGPESQDALGRAYQRAGYTQRYVACKRCHPETRCERSHGRAVLCGECGGQGWTDVIWVRDDHE